MADEEPRVSVHGIPQSQYTPSSPSLQSAPGNTVQPTGVWGHIEAHWPIYALGVGIATILVMILIARRSSSSTAVTDTSGTGTGNSSPDQLWGSQLDADFQQLMQSNETNNTIMSQILNGIKTSAVPPPSTTPPPGVTCIPGVMYAPGSPCYNGPPPPATGDTYKQPTSLHLFSIHPGQTLEGVALANGFQDIQGKAAWQQLYERNNNASIISRDAKSHGITAHFENYLYPGERIWV